MKILGLIIFTAALGLLPVSADWAITSPDHPAIWYNPSGMKVSQDLNWDRTRQMLVLNLAYDRVEFTPQNDQTYYDTFRLFFPTIHLNGSNNRLYFQADDGRHIEIGRIESGIFGNRAVLDDNYQLSAHRRDGRIEAKITMASGSGH
ncbi:MAG TPA: hypothetical protein VGC39_10325 [Candidatus Methylacidiphilales bacterium]